MALKNLTDPRDIVKAPEKSKFDRLVDYRDIPQAQKSIVDSRQPNNFVGSTGIGKSQYDYDIPFASIDNLNLIRAKRQSTPAQAFNSVIGGIGGGVLTFLEDAGYILDFDNNINAIRGVENLESNAFSKFMKENKQSLYESLPIYRKNPEKTFDASDGGWYWDIFRSTLERAVGFGGVGIGA